MKIAVLSHNVSSNAVLRAHRVALAARQFAEVKLLGPVESSGPWPALPAEPWIETVQERRFPAFHHAFVEIVERCEADVIIAVKPHMASYGAALVARELRGTPVILDHDDYDLAFAPRELWAEKPSLTDLRRPGSAVYISLLTQANAAANAVTAASTALQQKFGGTLLPHGCVTEWFDPALVNREAARQEFGFTGKTVLFAGTPRWHKGLRPLAKAVSEIGGATLAVFGREEDVSELEKARHPVQRLNLIPYSDMPRALVAADVLAIPQLDTEAARFQMPMKVYDCMAMGRPIVASAVSDLPKVLQDCGRIVPPGDSDALRDAIAGLLQDEQQGAQLGARARERCLREFSMPAVGKILQGVVERVLKQGA